MLKNKYYKEKRKKECNYFILKPRRKIRGKLSYGTRFYRELTILIPRKFAIAKKIVYFLFTSDILYSIIILKYLLGVINNGRDKKRFLFKSINKKRW